MSIVRNIKHVNQEKKECECGVRLPEEDEIYVSVCKAKKIPKIVKRRPATGGRRKKEFRICSVSFELLVADKIGKERSV
ncbi:hypothetical protein IMY05_008G0102300 [Salix suchowensis]|nr:hypothetical protein IMY05_008G0102300 [Salix suchowensis]